MLLVHHHPTPSDQDLVLETRQLSADTDAQREALGRYVTESDHIIRES